MEYYFLFFIYIAHIMIQNILDKLTCISYKICISRSRCYTIYSYSTLCNL